MSGVPIIGLTGGVASGKSTVADTLEELGCFVSDSDMISHEVLLEPEVVRALVDRWGEDILCEDGSPSRPEIGEVVFSDSKQRLWLEALLHRLCELPKVEHFGLALCEAGQLYEFPVLD